MSRVWKFGADVDTDQIVPGRYAPYMLKEGQDVKDYAFIEARPEFAAAAAAGDIIVAGTNFGCGSSREYAPEALRRRQIAAIIAPSFARIFYRNTINLGIPLYESADIARALDDGQEVDFDFRQSKISTGETIYSLPALPDFAAQIVDSGGITVYVKEHGHFPGE
ncbi:MAG: homoaconitate hydratase [Candidatus Promineifilaceae bacterium]|jgi:methanogen homoaconitase small subunit